MTDNLDQAQRLAETAVEPGTMFPYANGRIEWQQAMALAQVDMARSLREIANRLNRSEL